MIREFWGRGQKKDRFRKIRWTVSHTHVVDFWFRAAINGSLQRPIKKEADENKHICWRRSMYDKYHSRTRLSSRSGIRVCWSGCMTWRTSQRATQVWTSPASALWRSSDLIVGKMANCITFEGLTGAPLVGNSVSPDPRSMLATDLHMRARGRQRRFSATSALWRHKSTRLGRRESG